MKKITLFFVAACFAVAAFAQGRDAVDFYLSGTLDDWNKAYRSKTYPRYTSDEWRSVAANVVAYQNPDGGWPKNLDMLAKSDPDSVIQSLKPRHRLSTLDNRNVYPQVEFLSGAYMLTQDTVFRNSARRGIEYMLDTQYPNGGWRGWDADAITFNDGIMYGVLSTWLEVLTEKTCYDWIDGALWSRIRQSWEKGLAVVLKCQYVQEGVKTVWAQQYDHTTLQPSKARAYELPGLSASESADIAMLLMRIRKPSPEIVEAVKAAAAWFERSKISGKKVVIVDVPEGLPEDRAIKKDRILIDDTDAGPIWARYYDLQTNAPFFSNRAGDKVHTLAEVPAERRAGYAWYGVWGGKVLKKFPEWLRKVERDAAKKADE
ncbi:pectate lyase [uncultured Alistipes sp.]|jgi:pectate lyase|uniref:pectate lyase n=1 Tax=uncultured Alistipes sp. TaxID=538949 RepID=UPI0025D812FC|nr:pectate lyase [uncultured Alistipes sp.]